MMRISIIVDVLLLLVSPTPGYGAVPAQVTDLEAVFHNNHLDIKFTSPNTAVAKFIIKYAETAEDLQGSNFANDALNEEIEQSDLTHGSIAPPAEPGQKISLHVDPFEVFEGNTKYFFAMKSVTANMETSELSNIAQVIVDTAGDNTHPGAITDLTVTVVNDDLIINFTCPGDDGIGADPVAKIAIKYAVNENNINSANFHNDNLNDEIETEDLISGSLDPPHPAGNSKVSYEVKYSSIFETPGPYYFAVKTADDSYNWSPLSNIVSVTTNSTPNPDDIPTTVTDLTASYQSGDLSLSFTAPATSAGSQVSRFVVRYSHQREFVTENNFHNHEGNDEVEMDDLVSGTLVPPQPGSNVTLRLKPYEILDDDDGHYECFFSMMSVDTLNNWSKLSNIVSVSYTNQASSSAVNLTTLIFFLAGVLVSYFF